MGLKAYVCVNFGVPNGKQGCMFTSIPVQIMCYDPEVFALQLCQKTITGSGRARNVNPMLDLVQVAEAGNKMGALLDQVEHLLCHLNKLNIKNMVLGVKLCGRSLK